MPFHPNPLSMAVHVEHHRQELMTLAEQERLAKEAISGRPTGSRGRHGVMAAVANGIRSVAARWRPETVKPLELPQSTPGEAT
ncbi:MAG: hypothetical protein ACRDJC_18810 [Thermomicrobiales bacterium]